MVRFQQLAGCRPGEVRTLRPRDVDTNGDVWVYRPESHKTEHTGRERPNLHWSPWPSHSAAVAGSSSGSVLFLGK